jgi:hypothetical protein
VSGVPKQEPKLLQEPQTQAYPAEPSGAGIPTVCAFEPIRSASQLRIWHHVMLCMVLQLAAHSQHTMPCYDSKEHLQTTCLILQIRQHVSRYERPKHIQHSGNPSTHYCNLQQPL